MKKVEPVKDEVPPTTNEGVPNAVSPDSASSEKPKGEDTKSKPKPKK